MSDLAREVLDVVLDALDIPYAATAGDDEIRAKILDQRLMQLVVSLRALRDDPSRGAAWTLTYLREKLAEYPATGYRTWGEARTECREAGR
ncbi:hypothetical protein [Actinoallomurus sp. CA-142502]|uniref:hypothetical protein n=1 Tax=Actinoallomurus sp. CA-142502 TaxID=3239885 RepID=UPI003D8AFACD